MKWLHISSIWIFNDFPYWKSDLKFHYVRKYYLDLVISPRYAILDFSSHNVVQCKIWLFHHVVQYRNLYFTMLCNIRFGDGTMLWNNSFSRFNFYKLTAFISSLQSFPLRSFGSKKKSVYLSYSDLFHYTFNKYSFT